MLWLAGVAHLEAITVKGNWDIVNQTGQDAFDFHMGVYSDSNLTFEKSVNGAFGSFSASSSPYNPLAKSYNWSDGTVANGAKTHLGLQLSQKSKNEIIVQEAYWTDAKGKKIPPLGGFVKIPGFTVVPFGAAEGAASKTTLRLLNDTSEMMYLGDFSYSINSVETPLEDLRFAGPGLSVEVPDFQISPGSFFDVFTDVLIEDSEFLKFQGQSFADSAYSVVSVSFAGEHEHGTIPESGRTGILLVLATLGLSLFAAGWPREAQSRSC